MKKVTTASAVLSAFTALSKRNKKSPTNSDVSEVCGFGVETVRLQLIKAAKKGLISRVKGAKTRKFALK